MTVFPTTDPIVNVPAVLEGDTSTISVPLTGITDGDNGTQTVVAYPESWSAAIQSPAITPVSADGTATLTFTIDPTATGMAEITVAVSDGQTVYETFHVGLAPVNDAPLVVVGNHAGEIDSVIDIDLLTQVSDVEDVANLSFSVGAIVGGTAVLLQDGHTVRFTPTNGFQRRSQFLSLR